MLSVGTLTHSLPPCQSEQLCPLIGVCRLMYVEEGRYEHACCAEFEMMPWLASRVSEEARLSFTLLRNMGQISGARNRCTGTKSTFFFPSIYRVYPNAFFFFFNCLNCTTPILTPESFSNDLMLHTRTKTPP